MANLILARTRKRLTYPSHDQKGNAKVFFSAEFGQIVCGRTKSFLRVYKIKLRKERKDREEWGIYLLKGPMKTILPEREEKEATLPGILMYAPRIISRKR